MSLPSLPFAFPSNDDNGLTWCPLWPMSIGRGLTALINGSPTLMASPPRHGADGADPPHRSLSLVRFGTNEIHTATMAEPSARHPFEEEPADMDRDTISRTHNRFELKGDTSPTVAGTCTCTKYACGRRSR